MGSKKLRADHGARRMQKAKPYNGKKRTFYSGKKETKKIGITVRLLPELVFELERILQLS